MCGYLLLAPHTDKIREVKSLHHILGKSYGSSVRVVAGLCSLIGIIYMLGWEVSIGSETINSLIATYVTDNPSIARFNSNVITTAIVLGSIFYTVIGGLRGNGYADIFLNSIKAISIVVITVAAIVYFSNSDLNFWKYFFPPLNQMKANLGWYGLLTHIIFSLSWQFVDNSTWQNIIGGKEEQTGDSKFNVRWSGYLVFIAPGIIGTVLGVTLNSLQGITPDNILSQVLLFTPDNSLIILLYFLMIIGCIMSMIDGLFLASTFALVIDIFSPNTSMAELDRNPEKANRILLLIRITLVLIAIFAVWGVQALMQALNLSLFDFVYVVIITQLSLLGPVIFALFNWRGRYATVIILTSLIVGFGTVVLGNHIEIKELTDGAGSITAFTSLFLSFVFLKNKHAV